jgi:hypothetical protein
MLNTLAAILFVVWLLGLVSDLTAGGLIHFLLLASFLLIVAQLIHGRRNLKS